MSYPVNWFERVQAAFVIAITPEAPRVRALQGNRPKRYPEGEIHMPLEFREIDGVKVRIAQGGNPDGETLLMMCPLPQSIVAFEPIWHLLKGRYNLVALDLPGFGRSEGGVEFMTFEAQGRFVDSFVRELGLHDFHMVGPDVGMSAALHYVTHHDHTVKSLIIGDGPGIAPSSNGSVINKVVDSAFWRTVFTVAGSGPFVHAGNQIGYLNYVPHQAEVRDYVESYRGRIGPITKWFKSYPESLASVDPLLSRLDLPVQIFWGDMDQLLYVENAHRLHERLPRSSIRIFEHCGHYSYQDCADEFATMVTDWVDSGCKTLS